MSQRSYSYHESEHCDPPHEVSWVVVEEEIDEHGDVVDVEEAPEPCCFDTEREAAARVRELMEALP